MKNSGNIKKIYDSLYLSKEIQEIYKQIGKDEDELKGWAYHNLDHIENVTKIVSKILTKLELDEELIYKAKIACLLHEKKIMHIEVMCLRKNILKKNNIDFKDIDLVLEAIKIHSDGFDTNNIIALSLILADKLDVKKTRIAKEGRKVIGNRQYSHIEDININIENKLLKINFITDGNINLKEVNEYYFTQKIFKAIESFATKLDLKHLILMDNREWEILNKNR